jgi:uncharacterized membrane protein YkvA (DUF1232 family)
MPIQITLELSDADLAYFGRAMKEAQARTRGRDEAMILAGARQVARQAIGSTLPDFVQQRLRELDMLTRMLEDSDWELAGAHRKRVLEALAYFADPSDLVPDQIPGLGLLDDAIMIELVAQELRPELEAYDQFCAFRDEERAKAGIDPAERRSRLAARRREMYARMESRREERARRGGWLSIFH